MPGCSASGCSNRTENGFRMKQFPRDKFRRQQWAANVNRIGWVPSKSASLCQAHFTDDQFETHRKDGKRKLKPNAIPTIFKKRPASPKKKASQRQSKRIKRKKELLEEDEEPEMEERENNQDENSHSGVMEFKEEPPRVGANVLYEELPPQELQKGLAGVIYHEEPMRDESAIFEARQEPDWDSIIESHTAEINALLSGSRESSSGTWNSRWQVPRFLTSPIYSQSSPAVLLLPFPVEKLMS